MFTYEEAALLLDVPVQYVRAQVTVKTGLCYDAKRPRGGGVYTDELLELSVLKSVQRIVGAQSPAAQAIARGYKSFLAGVLQTPGRTIPNITIPLGDGSVIVQLHLPELPERLRERIALHRAGQPLSPRNTTLEVESVIQIPLS